MIIYNIKREKIELDYQKKKYKNVFNPNIEIDYNKETGMEPYFEALKT